jgi:hypothetical protein
MAAKFAVQILEAEKRRGNYMFRAPSRSRPLNGLSDVIVWSAATALASKYGAEILESHNNSDGLFVRSAFSQPESLTDNTTRRDFLNGKRKDERRFHDVMTELTAPWP